MQFPIVHNYLRNRTQIRWHIAGAEARRMTERLCLLCKFFWTTHDHTHGKVSLSGYLISILPFTRLMARTRMEDILSTHDPCRHRETCRTPQIAGNAPTSSTCRKRQASASRKVGCRIRQSTDLQLRKITCVRVWMSWENATNVARPCHFASQM